MRKHFYSHIIETSLISLKLGDMDLSKKERLHLLDLAHSQLHHVVMDTILSELSEDDKKYFLAYVASDEHGKIWELLNKRVEDVEEKIKKAAEDLKRELHEDIRKVRRKTSS